MKKWTNPSIVTLDVACTEQGKSITTSFDEIRVDQDGNYWASFSSGLDTNPDISGTVTKN